MDRALHTQDSPQLADPDESKFITAGLNVGWLWIKLFYYLKTFLNL